MAYPQAVATGNALIAAALARDDALTAWGRIGFEDITNADADRAEAAFTEADQRFDDAVAAHRAATAAAHVQGPNIDADQPGGT